jgi:methyltransferase (TIGR00027 family)
MELTDVSKTAIASSLRCHVLESEKKNPVINDPMAKYCLDRLEGLASADEKALLFHKRLSPVLTNHIALRARKYDSIANDFISRNPGCTLVNLGCGFDTRYWRINNENCEYIELDLPELIDIKKVILKDHLKYELIGSSVLDYSWIEKLTKKGNRDFLFLAEGLFMYLPKPEVMDLLRIISERFYHSQMTLEVVSEKYTRGIGKKIVIMKMKNQLGNDAGSSFNFGVKNAREIESYGTGIKVIEEWCYAEDPDIRPKIIKYFVPSRLQWTVSVTINEDK